MQGMADGRAHHLFAASITACALPPQQLHLACTYSGQLTAHYSKSQPLLHADPSTFALLQVILMQLITKHFPDAVPGMEQADRRKLLFSVSGPRIVVATWRLFCSLLPSVHRKLTADWSCIVCSSAW